MCTFCCLGYLVVDDDDELGEMMGEEEEDEEADEDSGMWSNMFVFIVWGYCFNHTHLLWK